MTSDEKALLSKAYDKFTIEDQVTFNTLINKKDLTQGDIESITQFVNNNFSEEGSKKYYIDKINGKETSDETKPTDSYTSTATEVNKYTDAKVQIKEYVDSNIMKDEKVKEYINQISVEGQSANKKFTITVNVYRPYIKNLAVSDIVNLRNNLVSAVQKYIDVDTIEIVLNNEKTILDTYIFTKSSGWDKQVTPWK